MAIRVGNDIDHCSFRNRQFKQQSQLDRSTFNKIKIAFDVESQTVNMMILKTINDKCLNLNSSSQLFYFYSFHVEELNLLPTIAYKFKESLKIYDMMQSYSSSRHKYVIKT